MNNKKHIKNKTTIVKEPVGIYKDFNIENLKKFVEEPDHPTTIHSAADQLKSDIQEAKEVIKKEFPIIDVDKWYINIVKFIKWCARQNKKYFKKT